MRTGTEKELAVSGGMRLALCLVFGMMLCAGTDTIGQEVAPADDEPKCTDSNCADGCDDESSDECGEEDALSMSLDELAKTRCEHDTEAYRCDACRYEIGVVKVPASLLKQPAGGGLVQTEKAAKKTVVSGIQATGEIHRNGNTTVHVPPLISGVIASVQVDLGSEVKAGDLLFTMNSTELGKSVAEYQRSRVLTELAKKTYDREQGLFDQKVTSEQDLIEAQMTYEEHKADLAASEQMLHVLGLTENDLKGLEEGHGTQIGLLPVRAPSAGTILERHAVIGELVEEGGEVVLLSDLSTLWVWIDVYERDLGKLLKAQGKATIPIALTVRAFPDRVFKGTIDYVGGTMEERTRTVKVRGVVQNDDRLLRPGMFCQATIEAGDAEEALAIPAGAVLSDEGTSFVFKHWKDEYYVRRAVELGRTFPNGVEILEGIAPGDTIVTEGAFLLKSDILREKMGAGCAD